MIEMNNDELSVTQPETDKDKADGKTALAETPNAATPIKLKSTKQVSKKEKSDREKKELEIRYPKNTVISTSEKDAQGVKKDRHKLSDIGREDTPRLVQISCDEAGRVNRSIDDEPYYHGFMTRVEAEGLLKKDGGFLVRKTDVAGHVHYVISVITDGNMHNFLIKRTNRKRLYWVYKFAFKSVGDLVQYHRRNREPIGADGTVIVKPCFKQDWQLNNEQVERTDKLGEGAFGEVWKGSLQISPFLPRLPVAVKTLLPTSMSSDERIKFLREANLMLQLSHDNVIRFYGVCTAKEPIMIVMELAAGSLLSVLHDTDKPPDATDKVNFVYGAAKGMAYLESKKIIHRDIAARNCLLGVKNEVKISDFGLSMLGNEFREKKMKNVPLRWLAPETLKKGKYSSKTDVYSYSILIWEIYSGGKLPYEEYENKELRKIIIDQKAELKVLGEIHPDVEALRLRCMSYDPEERPTFQELTDIIVKFDGVIIAKPPSGLHRLLTHAANKIRDFFSVKNMA